MNNRYAILVATSIFAISSTSAQVNAATKSKQQLNLKVAMVHAGDQKLSGTATKGAKIKVTRYAKTYGTGKVNAKSGKFTFKLKQPVKANWHYRVTVTKKGYKTKVVHFGAVEETGLSTAQSKHDADIAKLQVQIEDLNAWVNQISEYRPQTLINYINDGEITNLKQQVVDLKNKLSDSESDNTDEIGSLRNQINELQSQIANIKSNLNENSSSSVASNSDSGSVTSTATQPSIDQDYEARKAEAARIEQELNSFDEKIKKLQDEKYQKDWALDQVSWRSSETAQSILDYTINELNAIKETATADPQNQRLQLKIKRLQEQVDEETQDLANSIRAEKIVNGHEMDFSNRIDEISNELEKLYAQQQELRKQQDLIWNY